MALVAAELSVRFRQLLPELLKFGLVGGLGTVVDLGGAAILHGVYHVEPLAAKAASVSTATVISYLGSRFWTFKDRENQELKREAVLFIVLNVAGLLIAEGVVSLIIYVMGLHGPLAYNIASFLGTGAGTTFRYSAYKKWVFLAPGEEHPARSAAPAPRPLPGYPPWELDPAFLTSAAPEPGTGRGPVTAAALSSAREREPESSWDATLAPTISWSVPAPQPVAARTLEFPAQDFPATASPAPAQAPRRPVPARPPVPGWSPVPRSSGGGRHRKG
ncbi:MAG: GtrA family protein [Trebonia sp.]